MIERAWERVLWVATMVCWEHQQYLIVSDAIILQVLIEDHRIERVSVVEVELGRGKDDVDVVSIGVFVLFWDGQGRQKDESSDTAIEKSAEEHLFDVVMSLLNLIL